MENNHPSFGNGKICYVELPAVDINNSVTFYKEVFNWNIRTNSEGKKSFDDIVNEVSGTWVLGRKPSTADGLLIYIMVDNIETTIKLIIEKGCKIVQQRGTGSPEIFALFSDPAGNILGLYQH